MFDVKQLFALEWKLKLRRFGEENSEKVRILVKISKTLLVLLFDNFLVRILIKFFLKQIEFNSLKKSVSKLSLDSSRKQLRQECESTELTFLVKSST